MDSKSQDQEQWRKILEEAKVCIGTFWKRLREAKVCIGKFCCGY
jgi:dissimilatory sulfite reductase (desulfoviridin) alpha/beta subunit